MEKIMQSLINNWIRGVDTYTHNGSTWLIFTDSKRWVIELTEDKTLWYNYNFFKQIFSLTSLDVVENQQYITKWVEDNVMNKVKDTRLEINITEGEVDDIIQDGVKETDYKSLLKRGSIEDTIENGVKETKISPTHTEYGDWLDGDERLDEIIQNGVKETQFNSYENKSWVEGVIKGGVKTKPALESHEGFMMGTPYVDKFFSKEDVEDTIQNGVKKTHFDSREIKTWVNDVINEGVKETTALDPSFSVRYINGDFEMVPVVEEIIKNGIKKTKTPGKDGDILGVMDWMEENKTNSVPKMIDDIIENGVKVSGTFVGGKRQKEDVESVIGYGTKNPTD